MPGRRRQTTARQLQNGHAFLTATGLLLVGGMAVGCSWYYVEDSLPTAGNPVWRTLHDVIASGD